MDTSREVHLSHAVRNEVHGVVKGHLIQAGSITGDIHIHEPPAYGAPRQLPSVSRHFTGREAELATLNGLLAARTEQAGTTVICAVTGMAGVGKTTLALRWAHSVADRFPDGQLYANLRGFDPDGSPVKPTEAVRGFLSALGVPSNVIPADLDQQVKLYRTVLVDKQVLVVLDNARDSEQVVPLLPAGSSCLVLVTSRDRMTGLVTTEGAHTMPMRLLDVDQATLLLARRLGTQWVNTEPRALADLTRWCGGLPLALSVVAARAAGSPGLRLCALVEELRGEQDRLDVFDIGETEVSLRAVLSWSYKALSTTAGRMFLLLAQHPGPDIGLPAAASLAGTTVSHTRRALAELTKVNLLEEHSLNRFRCHDLVRVYAQETAHHEAPPEDARAAIHRVLDHYLHTAQIADSQLNPHRLLVPVPQPEDGVRPQPIADHEAALQWFETEHSVILAAVEHAARHGFDVHALHLPWTLTTFFHRYSRWRDYISTQEIALAAATRLGDTASQARAHRLLCRAYVHVGGHEQSLHNGQRALDLLSALNDPIGRAHTHNAISETYERLEEYGKAIRHAQKAVDVYRQVGRQDWEADALNHVGWYYALSGDFATALTHCEQALLLNRATAHRSSEAETLCSLGYVHRHLGDLPRATEYYGQAVVHYTKLGHLVKQAEMLDRLAETHHSAGELSFAREKWQLALLIYRKLSHPDADRVGAQLLSLTP